MAKEEWKSIKGYEGRYKISSNGKVYSLISNKELKSGCKRRELIKRYGLTISQIDSFLYGHMWKNI